MQCLRFAKVAIKCQLSHINELKDPGLFHTICLPDLVLVWDHYDIANQRGESGSHILNLDIWRCLVMIQRCVVIWSSPHLFVNLLAASCPNSGDADLRKPDTLLLPGGAVSQQCNESHNDAELHVCKLYIWSIKECNDKKQLACLLMKLLSMAHFTEKGPLTCFFRIVLLQFSTLSFSGVGGSLSPCLVFC